MFATKVEFGVALALEKKQSALEDLHGENNEVSQNTLPTWKIWYHGDINVSFPFLYVAYQNGKENIVPCYTNIIAS